MKLTIHGSIPSKKNSRVNVMGANGRIRSFPNQTYVKWERAAYKELMFLGLKPFIEYPVRMKVNIWAKDKVGRDIDNMLSSLMDLLKTHKYKGEIVRQGIIDDDDWRHVNPITVEVVGIDKLNPRAEIEILDNVFLV